MSRRFTWSDIFRLYMNACEQTTAAATEFLDHATSASRQLATKIDEKELTLPNATIVVKKDIENHDWDEDAYAIISVFNLTSGERVEPDEEGWRGRSRYMETTGKPPPGTIHRYHPEGKKLWFRDLPSEDTTLQITFKIYPPDVSQGTLQNHPVFPPHMDLPLMYMSVADYYALHPGENMIEKNDRTTGQLKSDYYNALANATLIEQKSPKTIENRDRREAHVQWGYRMW